MISAKPAQNFEGSRADHCRSSLDFRQLAAHGVTLLDRVKAVQNGWLELAPDIAASLAHGDAAYTAFLDTMDAHIERHGLDVPREPDAPTKLPDPPCLVEPLLRLNLRAAAVGAVIWATG
jgi:putative flavoprotein involved in K+ transport